MEGPKSPMEDPKKEAEKLFTQIGLKPGVVKSTLKSKKVTGKLMKILNELKVSSCNEKEGILYYEVATCCPPSIEKYIPILS